MHFYNKNAYVRIRLFIPLVHESSVPFTMGALENIIAILDMDGFVVNRHFYCQDLGVLRFGDLYAESYFFDIGLRWSDLTPKDQRSCECVQTYIHQLPFDVPDGIDALPLRLLEDIITDFYLDARRASTSVMAYKGRDFESHFERDVLTRLGIPAIDLEQYGCPKAEKLMDRFGVARAVSWAPKRKCIQTLSESRSGGLWMLARQKTFSLNGHVKTNSFNIVIYTYLPCFFIICLINFFLSSPLFLLRHSLRKIT